MDDPTNSITSQTTRGFTNHEHISNVGLINMNARTYDPVVGRFLTPDSMIEDYFKGQILNRYSYVGNNPLSFTDPTGMCFLGCFWKSSIFKMVAITAAVLTFNAYVLAPYLTSACFVNGMAALSSMAALPAQTLIAIGAIEGAISGAVLSGNLSGAWQGAVSGAIFSSIGSLANAANIAEGSVQKIAMSGVGGGVSSVIQGGKFQSGFLAAGFSEFAGPHINKLPLKKLGETTALIAGGVARGAIGGTASVLGGGKFENGAITSAFQYLYNHSMHFDGKEVVYKDDDGKELWRYPSSSGSLGVTDQSLPDNGPIPSGEWSIDPTKISEARGLFYLSRWLYGDWGHYRVPLSPSSSVHFINRNPESFFMHGGYKPGSAGCIDVGQNEDAIFKSIRKHDGPISLSVRYPAAQK